MLLTHFPEKGVWTSARNMLINMICYCSETGHELPWAGLGWNAGVLEARGLCVAGRSVTLIDDCLQGTGEGGTEPEERQAAQGPAAEAHGDVVL